MYTLISGSPKIKESNSIYFLNKVSSKLIDYSIYDLKKHDYLDIIESINKSEVVVLAFPLYVDSPTSITLNFLDYIIDENIRFDNKLFYFIINCGFREGQQNTTALNIVKLWCEKVGAKYNGAILIGAGEIVGKNKYKFISRKALKKLNGFFKKLQAKENIEEIITTMDIFNNSLYCFFANLSWTKRGKKNKLTKEEILKQ